MNETTEATETTEQPEPIRAPIAHTSATISKLVLALCRAQGKYKPVLKNCEGKVTYKAKEDRAAGGYTFKYADLGAVIEATAEALASEELAHTALIGDGRIRVLLMHSSGEWMDSVAPLDSPLEVGNQGFGSQVTYMRRYLLGPLLGVASEDDDDGNAHAGNQFQKQAVQKQASQGKPAEQPKTKSEPTKVAEPAKKSEEPKPPSTAKKLVERLTLCGKETKEKALAWMTTMMERKIESTGQLTESEALFLLDAAGKLPEVASATEKGAK
jgi:hypothetical protein